MENVVELRPGQKIHFIVEGKVLTPFGEQPQETRVALSYEEILTKFRQKSGNNHKVPVQARMFNRFTSLALTALEDGKWLHGAEADKPKIAEALTAKILALPPNLNRYVAEKAQNNLKKISTNRTLNPAQKQAIETFLERLFA